MGLLPLRRQASLVLADGGDRSCPVMYCVEIQSTVSISTQRVVLHTLAVVESIDIGSFVEGDLSLSSSLPKTVSAETPSSFVPCRSEPQRQKIR